MTEKAPTLKKKILEKNKWPMISNMDMWHMVSIFFKFQLDSFSSFGKPVFLRYFHKICLSESVNQWQKCLWNSPDNTEPLKYIYVSAQFMFLITVNLIPLYFKVMYQSNNTQKYMLLLSSVRFCRCSAPVSFFLNSSYAWIKLYILFFFILYLIIFLVTIENFWCLYLF